MSKQFSWNNQSFGDLRVARGTGDKGDFALYDIPVAHANDKGYAILIYVRGSFERFNDKTGLERIKLSAGEDNSKVGFRSAGLYRLEALEDDTVQYCIWHKSKAVRPNWTKVMAPFGEELILMRDDFVIIAAGAIRHKGLLVGTDNILRVSSVPFFRFPIGPSGCIYHHFKQGAV